MGEKSLLTKCYACISLIPSLHTTSWIILKTISDISITVIETLILMVALPFDPNLIHFPLVLKMAFIIAILDLVFVSILSYGLSNKNVLTVTIAWYYDLALIVLVSGCLIGLGSFWYVNGLEKNNLFGVQMLALAYLADSLYVDICVSITMKNDLIKLRNNEHNELSKMPHKVDSQNTLLPIEQLNLVYV